jgi:hypothetical protein
VVDWWILRGSVWEDEVFGAGESDYAVLHVCIKMDTRNMVMEQLLNIIKIDFVLFLIVVAFVKLMKFLGKGLRFSEIFIFVHKWYKMKKSN